MGRYLIFAVLLSAIILALYNTPNKQESDLFEEWKGQYGAAWPSEQDVYRRFIFYQNLAIISQHNKDPTQTYKMGVNQFAVYTAEEFHTQYLSPLRSRVDHQIMPDYKSIGNVDWTSKGIVSPIKDQGSCSSSWAFSLTALLQSMIASNGQFVSLSEQQLVDCTRKYGNRGCSGGYVNSALVYVQLYGLSTNEQYPYVGKEQSCMINGGGFRVDDYVFSSFMGCSKLVDLIQKGPVSIGVDAANWTFYKSGFFNNCGNSPNQAVLLVGMIDGNWKIKNSWGTSWGEKGYIRLASGNTCGICSSQLMSMAINLPSKL